jgi:predicted nicotinamide N-methyase
MNALVGVGLPLVSNGQSSAVDDSTLITLCVKQHAFSLRVSSQTDLETGGSVWFAGYALARYILDHPETVRGKAVLELGAGCGLVSLAAAMAGARRVVATDLAVQLPLLRENMRFNADPDSGPCHVSIR